MLFSEIEKFTTDANYRINLNWADIEFWIKRQQRNNLNLDPDFQREHVWTYEQQKAYIEFCLHGGKGSNVLRFNCAGWMKDYRGPFELVDGKQRLQAVRLFLSNEIDIYHGVKFKDFKDSIPCNLDFIIMINDLNTRKDVLKWYLEINTGGTPHTKKELEKVRKLMSKIVPE